MTVRHVPARRNSASPTPPTLDAVSTIAPTPGPPLGRPAGALGGALAVIAAFAVLLTGAAAAPLVGDPGAVTRWGLPLARAVTDVAAALTIGLLVLAAVVLPPAGTPAGRAGQPRSGSAPLGGSTLRVVRIAGGTAAVWVAAAAVVIVLTYARAAGVAPSAPGFLGQLSQFLTTFELLRALLISALVAAVVAAGAVVTLRQNAAGWLAVLSIGALLPVALTGHAAGSADHELAVDSLAAHLVGVSVWFGGLAALALMRRMLGQGLPVAVRRYSTLALWSFVLVAASGTVNVAVRLGGWAGLGTPYGVLLLAKVAALVLLGLAGWWHRARTIARLDAAVAATSATGRGLVAPFWRLVLGELTVMAVAVGAGVALANSAPPAADLVGAGSAGGGSAGGGALALTGYPMPAPLTASTWLTTWRIDLLWTSVAVLLAGLYLAGAVRLARRGDRWPVLRTVPFVAGCLVLVWATGGAPGVYGRVLFSAHMLGHMVVTMVVPPLLVLGAPATLALRTLPGRRDGSHGPREWLLAVVHSRLLAVLGHPLVAAGMFAGSLVVFYYTQLFELALRTHTGHVLMYAHFLLAGYLFASVLIGIDPGPHRPAHPLRLVLLFATMTFHAFFGVALISGTRLLAPGVLGALARPWGRSPLADQQYGGAVVWGVGELPVLALAVAIALAWVRSDEREARRRDRQADRDGGAELAAYNEHLGRLAEPGRPGSAHGSAHDR
jgi:cytochrome c oxidase assembly factor CtaG/putative copper export protein